MKFQLAINIERLMPDLDMTDVERYTLEMVQMDNGSGFATAWAAGHHALEMTIAPNPFQILTWWATHTSRIRLGSAVVAAYWHPIKAAGEAALLDLYIGLPLGGMIARRVALDHADRVSALAVLNLPHDRSLAAREVVRQRIRQTEAQRPSANVEPALERWFTVAFRAQAPETTALVRAWITGNDPAGPQAYIWHASKCRRRSTRRFVPSCATHSWRSGYC